MKRLSGLVVAVALVLGATPSYAQTGGGLLGGVNFTKVSLSGVDTTGFDSEFGNGLVFGGFLTVPVSSTVAIMPEVAYSQKHFKLTGADGGDTFSQKLEVDFISVPVLFKIGPQTGGFYFVAGPGFHFRTKAKATDTEFNGQSFPEGDEDLKDDTESFDFSLIAGAGWANRNFGLEARYDHGLRDLNKPEDNEDFKVKPRAFTILAKIYFK